MHVNVRDHSFVSLLDTPCQQLTLKTLFNWLPQNKIGYWGNPPLQIQKSLEILGVAPTQLPKP